MAEVVLTKAQHDAVYGRGGRLLVSAAAGSGKTKVLVDRLLSYICDSSDPANVDEFLIITYTKAAAAELRGKISSALAERLAKEPGSRHLQKQFSRIYLAKISTVHAFCGDILREYAYRLNIPSDFRIAETSECGELRQRAMDQVMEEAYRRIGSDEDLQELLDTLGAGRTDHAVSAIVADVYDKVQCHKDPDAFMDYCVEMTDVNNIASMDQTPWGQALLSDFWDHLDEQKRFFEGLACRAEEEGFGEKVIVCLRSIAGEFEKLREETVDWEHLSKAAAPSFGRLPAVKDPPDPDFWERVKTAKSKASDQLRKKLQNLSLSSADALKELHGTGRAIRAIFRLTREFDAAYRREKDRRRAMDFSDLEHLAIRLLLSKEGQPTSAAREIGRRFREVMVDEYQDTNGVQDAIFAALTDERCNAFFVGDVKQSIYQFRLADPGIFLKKYESYQEFEQAKEGADRKILLSENFRSGDQILQAVNDVFSRSMTPKIGGLYYGSGETLKEGVPHEPLGGPEVELHCITYAAVRGGNTVKKEAYEADFAAERISSLIRKENYIRGREGLRRITARDIVILLRAPASSSKYYIEALRQRGISCVTGERGDILSTEEIGFLISFLRVIENPQQDIPLVAALASPVFGFTADRLASIRAEHRGCSIYDCLQRCADSGQADVAAFLNKLEDFRALARTASLTELINGIFRDTGIEYIFAAMSGGQERQKNLRLFYQEAASLEANGRKELSQFLSYLELLGEKGLRPEEGEPAADAVRIMSIHKSKGLEFPVVILGNLSKGFNKDDLSAPVLSDPELGVGCRVVDLSTRVSYPSYAHSAIRGKKESQMISEELRVLYVAMTRAKDRLIMLYTGSNLEKKLADLSLDMSIFPPEVLSKRADSMGDWVLLEAMSRTEAGALHKLGGRPQDVSVRKYPWLIQVHEGVIRGASVSEIAKTPQDQIPVQDLRDRLSYAYPHTPATQAPSKLTATQMKGRFLDQEAADRAPVLQRNSRPVRYADFSGSGMKDPREAGIATHLAMQFLDYVRCDSLEGVQNEVSRLERQAFLTSEQAAMVDCCGIFRFFQSSMGRRLRTGEGILREFKFSVLENGEELDPRLRDESFLLQGVVDCCIVEPDGLTILDFKTDRVKPGQEQSRAEEYGPQVRTYGSALCRIFDRPVKRLYLYFFASDALVEIKMEKTA